MADKKTTTPETQPGTEETKKSLTEQVPELGGIMQFIKKYQNILFIAGAAILAVVVVMLLRGGGSSTKELNAEKAIQPVRQYMQMDSFNLVLNGNDSLGIKGVKKFLSTHKGTKAANEMRIYGAICYMATGNPSEAIKLLKDAGSFGKQMNARKNSLLGDAYSEKGMAANPVNQSDCNEAIDYYRKAADAFPEDENNSAAYLYKAAQLYSQTGKADKAKQLLKEIKDKYPGSSQTNMVEKYLGKEGVED